MSTIRTKIATGTALATLGGLSAYAIASQSSDAAPGVPRTSTAEVSTQADRGEARDVRRHRQRGHGRHHHRRHHHAATTAEPPASAPAPGHDAGDDRGGRGEVEAGDDRGGRGEVEAGDDRGGRGEVEAGDDHRGHGGESGHGGGHGGPGRG